MQVMLSPFVELTVGQLTDASVFRVGKEVYMKINNTGYNAVNLRTGNLGGFDANLIVTIVRGKFVEDSSAIVIEKST